MNVTASNNKMSNQSAIYLNRKIAHAHIFHMLSMQTLSACEMLVEHVRS